MSTSKPGFMTYSCWKKITDFCEICGKKLDNASTDKQRARTCRSRSAWSLELEADFNDFSLITFNHYGPEISWDRITVRAIQEEESVMATSLAAEIQIHWRVPMKMRRACKIVDYEVLVIQAANCRNKTEKVCPTERYKHKWRTTLETSDI